MKNNSLLGISPDIPDDESFETVLENLNVPVERQGQSKQAKTLTDWITARGGGHTTIKDLRLNKSIMSFSEKAAKLFEVDPGVYRFAFRLVDYEGSTAILLKPDKKGIKLNRYDRSVCYSTSYTKTMKKLFREHNVKLGDYEITKVKNGYLAILEE